jgi:predicted N-formylglutamate amidohydrolase
MHSPPASPEKLLAPDEPPAFTEVRAHGGSDFVILVDHASARIPRSLANLGLPAEELQRHIAWDIGALAVARQVSAALDAPLLAQNYSRLVIDCNRDPKVASSIPAVSEYTAIPGNTGLTETQRAMRRMEIFDPYHERIRELLDARAAAGRPTILIAQHSMTDEFKGSRREMHAAVLYNRDRRFAGLVLDALRRDPTLVVAENQPYYVSDATDYSIPVHGERRGLLHVEIEVRQDLLLHPRGQRQWADRITGALENAQRHLDRV